MARQENEQQSAQDQDWTPCTSRELMQLSHGLQARQARRQFLRGSLVAGGLAAVLGGSYLLLTGDGDQSGQNRNGYDYAKITCDEVMQAAKTLKKDPALVSTQKRSQIREHVARCPHCKPKYEEMQLLQVLS